MKSFLLFLSTLFFSLNSLAQETTYGARVGINVSNLDFTPAPTFDNLHRNGFVFGGFVDYYVTENASFYVELQYSAEGGKDKNLRADYIQLPVLFQLELLPKFSVGVGPQVSLKTWKYRDVFETLTFSGVIGIEYMISGEIFIDARYNYGFSNILDDRFSEFEAKNNTFQFGIGMKI